MCRGTEILGKDWGWVTNLEVVGEKFLNINHHGFLIQTACLPASVFSFDGWVSENGKHSFREERLLITLHTRIISELCFCFVILLTKPSTNGKYEQWQVFRENRGLMSSNVLNFGKYYLTVVLFIVICSGNYLSLAMILQILFVFFHWLFSNYRHF